MNQEAALNAFYENEGVEEIRLMEGGAHYLEYLTATGFMDSLIPPGAAVLDNCAGTGAYAFYLAGRGCIVTAGDIVPHNVEIMRHKQKEHPVLADIYYGSAQQSPWEDASFDVVLCMGALYHIHEPQGRKQAVLEAKRLVKPGGLVFFTYMNRYAVILNNTRDKVDNLEEILEYAGHGREGIFHASTPEAMEALIAECGLEKRHHAALDGVSNFLHGTAGLIDDDGLAQWRRYHAVTNQVPSLLGYSYHNLIIAAAAA
ncbi:class I SAM-dependent methyltransferase [Ruminococcaceae bacterium OttesenSCG-928-L11]|nr:class I SAM-dependent methyltransferase [Ruminococcaceae bacterium OttesenSCG-928-L11]